MPREAVAGADGEDAQRDAPSDEPLRRLVHRAVAADREHDVELLALRALDHRVEILLAPGRNDLALQLGLADHVRDVERAFPAGTLVDDEEGLHGSWQYAVGSRQGLRPLLPTA